MSASKKGSKKMLKKPSKKAAKKANADAHTLAMKRAIRAGVSRGVPLYRKGDIPGCTKVYRTVVTRYASVSFTTDNLQTFNPIQYSTSNKMNSGTMTYSFSHSTPISRPFHRVIDHRRWSLPSPKHWSFASGLRAAGPTTRRSLLCKQGCFCHISVYWM